MSNLHATDQDGRNFPSKKALREHVAAGKPVTLVDTSAFNPRGTVALADVQPVDVIVGPDPYRDRRWYANIKKGKVV